MKQKIIPNTLLFIFIILFVNIFNTLFGKENSLVGVSTIVAALVLLSKDLTKNSFNNFSKLLLVNIGLGVSAYIAAHNIWVGFFINFIVLASIGYFLSYNFTKELIVAFGLQYNFMLYTPVNGVMFGKRLLGLMFAAVFIMVLQLIVNGKKKKIEVEKSDILEFEEEDNDSKTITILGKSVQVHPVRAGYAIRVGLLTAITAFIAGYFELAQGRWMTYTIFSLTELYSEHCKVRSKQRLEGTIIGASIVILLFMIIKDNTIRLAIVLLGGYLDTYTTNYRDKIICVTISVVAAMSISDGSIYSSMQRIMYVFIGAVIALIANKYIFSFSKEEDNKNMTLGFK